MPIDEHSYRGSFRILARDFGLFVGIGADGNRYR
jgi:hypothetical protein